MKYMSSKELKSIRAGAEYYAENFGDVMTAYQQHAPNGTWADTIQTYHDQGNNVGQAISSYARNPETIRIIIE